MKPLLLLGLLFWVQFQLVAQPSLPKFNSAKTVPQAFINYLPAKADFILAYSEESYWWSNTESFKLLSKAGDKWMTWTYYRKWKSSSDVVRNKGKKKKKFFSKVRALDSFIVKELLDSLALIDFWALQADSLNETRGVRIADDVAYKFQIETVEGRQILESYAPEFYLDKFPDMHLRAIFLRGKKIFKHWWKKYYN